MASPVIDRAAALTPGGRLIPFPKRDVQEVVSSEPTSTVKASVKPKKLASRPRGILFGVMTDPRLRLKRPIRVEITRKKGAVVAHSREFDEFGCGASMSDALDDFSKGLAELFLTLRKETDRLGPDLQRLQQRLGKYIEERSSR